MDESAKLILGDTAISALETPPRRGRRFFRRKKDERGPLTHCENCGTSLSGQYCGQCGQPAIDYRRSFRHVIVDVLDSFLNWDSKFLATIALLIVKPWKLTNEFLAGRRVRYVHPLRLYLLASILFFFAASFGAKSMHIDTRTKRADLPPEAKAKLDAAIEKVPSEARAEVDAAMKKVEEEKDQPVIQFSGDKQPKSPFEKWMQERAKEKFGEHGTKAQAFLITLLSNLPYMMLCAIPLFAFVLKVLYIRKHIFYIDHLVYALHIHTFAYVAVMVICFTTIGLNRVAPNISGLVLGLLITAAVFQIFFSIRRVYRQGWFFTLFKFFFGGLVYLIVLSVALAATFLITIALPS
jgi:hypothetical protein